VLEVEIANNIKNLAEKHTIERIKFEFDRFGLGKEQRISMILIGTIGQLIFKKYLEENNINFKYELQAGKYDDIDFEINKNIIEVKTSGFNQDWQRLNLLYSDSQFFRGTKKKYAYCIQIFINGYDRQTKILDLKKCNKAVIAGGIKFNDIKNFRNERLFFGDDYKVPLNKLKPIEEIIKEVG